MGVLLETEGGGGGGELKRGEGGLILNHEKPFQNAVTIPNNEF